METPPKQLERVICRDTYLSEIQSAIAELGSHNRNILVYYGEPDHTWQLSKSLYRTLSEQGHLCALVDGEGLKSHASSQLDEGLSQLRSKLGKGGIDFSCYDIAYWCYWSARYPQLAIDSVEFSQKMSQADKLSAFADLVGAAQDLDLSGVIEQMNLADMTETARALIPQMMRDVGKLAEDAIPFGVFVAKLYWFLVGLDERRRLWWQERGSHDLRELKADCDSPFDVLPRLPLFLARDLKHHFRRSDLPPDQQSAVVFVDGYHHLIDQPKQGQCSWLEAMLAQEEASPYVLWVITADHRLAWMEDAQQIPVLPLSEAESDEALQTLGVHNAAIRQAMVQAAQGSPWHLEVCFQTWTKLRQRRLPQSEDFTGQLNEALQLEDEAWEAGERQIYQLLAVPRFWDWHLFQALLVQFLSTSPDEAALQQRLDALSDSPYVLALEDGTWRWHPMVREHLLNNQPQEQRQAVHHWLFAHYQTLSAEPSQEIFALDEALYHGLNLEEPQTAIDWFLEAILVPIQHRPHAAIPVMLRRLIDSLNDSSPQVALAQNRLGQVLAALYEWEDAESALETAIEHWDTLQQSDSLAAADTWYALSEVYLARENTFNSLTSAQSAGRIRAELEGTHSLAYAQALSRQAEAQAERGQMYDALALSNQAIGIAEALPEIEPMQLIQLKWEATLVRSDKNTLDEAKQSCQEVLDLLAQQPGGEEHYLFIRGQALMGDIYRLMGQHKGQQAFECYQQAIEKAERLWGADNEWTLTFLDAQIELCRKLGDYDKADELESQRGLYAKASDLEATVNEIERLSRVGIALGKKGQYGKAEPIMHRALATSKLLLDETHPEIANCLNNLAVLYDKQGRYSEAELLHQEVLAIRKRLSIKAASSLNSLAGVYLKQGRYSEAEPLLQESLAVRKQLLGNEHIDVASSLNHLAFLHTKQGRYSEAEPLLQEALSMRKQLLGDTHPDVASSLNNLAMVYFHQGCYSRTKLRLEEAIKIYEQLFGKTHPDIAQCLNNLGLLHCKQKHYGEAERRLKDCLAMRKRLLGESHPNMAESMNNLAAVYCHQGRYSEAELLFQEALSMRKQLDKAHPDLAQSLNNLAELYAEQGRYSEAEPLFQEALSMRKQLLGDTHPDVASSLNNLAGIYDRQGIYGKAEPLFQKSLSIARQKLGESHPDTQRYLNNVINCLMNLGKPTPFQGTR
ncbi:MAG: tetratricopeptide repeat protein [Cyanobacteria bacterium P01_A01_bin.123]